MLLSSDPLLGPGAADWFCQLSPFRLSSRPAPLARAVQGRVPRFAG